MKVEPEIGLQSMSTLESGTLFLFKWRSELKVGMSCGEESSFIGFDMPSGGDTKQEVVVLSNPGNVLRISGVYLKITQDPTRWLVYEPQELSSCLKITTSGIYLRVLKNTQFGYEHFWADIRDGKINQRSGEGYFTTEWSIINGDGSNATTVFRSRIEQAAT